MLYRDWALLSSRTCWCECAWMHCPWRQSVYCSLLKWQLARSPVCSLIQSSCLLPWCQFNLTTMPLLLAVGYLWVWGVISATDSVFPWCSRCHADLNTCLVRFLFDLVNGVALAPMQLTVHIILGIHWQLHDNRCVCNVLLPHFYATLHKCTC